MEDVSHSLPRTTGRAAAAAKPSPVAKKPRRPSKTRAGGKQKMSLAEARKAAQEEVEKRIQERAKLLSASKKKK
ncbi:hypothetical protein PHPALM_18021 [Phytophthora palmivora]|uniref:Uncharacterized protein n=1 Tax=Phytophthora palmivora TaxID=4796 RepID=A0A2P4XKT0_9STRA|nr:hypothetical protein PHPALM_18021 [Phytophthora palmivora]